MNIQEVKEQMGWRAATKSFDPEKKVSDSDFADLMEVVRLTPSSYGLQPWKFVVVKDVETRKKLQAAAYNQAQVGEASHLLVLCTQKEVTLADVGRYMESIMKVRGNSAQELEGFKGMLSGFVTGKNPEQLKLWAQKQVYIALGNVLTACAVAGIDSCPMEGFDAAQFNEILGLEKLGLEATLVCAIGYRSANDYMSKIAKVRYPKEEVIMEI